MSRIFSLEELVKGAVPLPKDFSYSLEVVRKIMKKEATSLVAGLHFGSTHPKRNDLDITSDIDVLIIYDGERKENAFTAMKAMADFAAHRHVPLQIIPFELHVAESGFHTVGEDFAHHLTWAARNGGVINNNPLEYLAPHRVRWDAKSYIMGKLSSILKGYIRLRTMGEEEHRQFLRRALDVPAYLGRKVLWEMGEKLEIDSKTQVSEVYGQRVGGRAAQLFRRISEAKENYRKMVERCRYGSVSERWYNGYLGFLDGRVEDVIELLEVNASILARIGK